LFGFLIAEGEKEPLSLSCCVLKIDDASKSLCRAACCKIYPITFSSSFLPARPLIFSIQFGPRNAQVNLTFCGENSQKQTGGASSGYFGGIRRRT